MLLQIAQTTLAFAPRAEDLDEVYFDAPVIVARPAARDDEEGELGEVGEPGHLNPRRRHAGP